MTIGPRYRVPFRRRREGKTDYRHRLRLLRAGQPRAIVRFSRSRVLVAVTAYEPTGDRVLAAAESRELGQVGFPLSARVSTPASYLTGYLAGLRAKARGATQAVLDTGLRRPSPGGRILGALQGLLDAGIFIPHGKSAFPPIERLSGTHLEHKLPKPIEVYKADLAQSLGRTPPEGA